MKRPRDSQRSKVYKAEGQLPAGDKIISVPEIRTYLTKVLQSRFFRNRWPHITEVHVKDGRGRYIPCAGWSWKIGYYITLPRGSRYEKVILHELAHIVTYPKYAWHGPEFVKNFIVLLEWKMTVNPRQIFREYKVKWYSRS